MPLSAPLCPAAFRLRLRLRLRRDVPDTLRTGFRRGYLFVVAPHLSSVARSAKEEAPAL